MAKKEKTLMTGSTLLAAAMAAGGSLTADSIASAAIATVGATTATLFPPILAVMAASAFCIGKPAVTAKKEGSTTIYNIQNVNIYLNAQMVQQLNMNPKEVVNQISKELEKYGNKD